MSRSAQLGLKLTVAIALHNIPEGLAIGTRERVCVSVCVRERENQRETDRHSERERDT